MLLKVELDSKSYDVVIEKGSIAKLSEYLDVGKRYAIITDDGVPTEYLRKLKQQLPASITMVVPQGEESKSLERLETICQQLLHHHFARNDVLIALGGGVIGDLVGFTASVYMRGIEYINIPTTTLSQIDSSIGGKTAVNLHGRKNIIGSFYQPAKVIIDPDTLQTLTRRHYNSGLIEALKAGLLADKELYKIFLAGKQAEKITELIQRALLVKKAIVEEDERELGKRQLLNFGHTVGHALESYYGLHNLYHGEAVLNGMLPLIKDPLLQTEIAKIASQLGIPLENKVETSELMKYIKDDKKHTTDKINIIELLAVERPLIEEMTYHELEKELSEYYAR